MDKKIQAMGILPRLFPHQPDKDCRFAGRQKLLVLRLPSWNLSFRSCTKFRYGRQQIRETLSRIAGAFAHAVVQF